MDFSNQVPRPPDTRTQDHFSIAWPNFENLYEFDIQNIGNDRDGLFQEFLQIAFSERRFAQARDRVLLTRPQYQFSIDPHTLGHIPADPQDLRPHAIPRNKRNTGLKPASPDSRSF